MASISSAAPQFVVRRRILSGSRFSSRLGPLAVALLFLIAADAAPQAGQGAVPSCDERLAPEFDFWVGDWAVTQEILTETGGWESYPARSSVSRALGGCALVERWRGQVRFFWEGMAEPEPLEGLSVRFPDSEGTWRIYWIDTRGMAFGEPFVGGFVDGEGVFTRTTRDTGAGETVARIRFFDIREESVEWELSVYSENGGWTPLWRMHFKRTDDARLEPGDADGTNDRLQPSPGSISMSRTIFSSFRAPWRGCAAAARHAHRFSLLAARQRGLPRCPNNPIAGRIRVPIMSLITLSSLLRGDHIILKGP